MRALFALMAMLVASSALSHEIYTDLRSKKSGMLCCGGNDCAATVYRERGERFFFLTREKTWVEIPKDRIDFLPIPGDGSMEPDLAHLCYRPANDFDRAGPQSANVFDGIYLYCAFIPPGSI